MSREFSGVRVRIQIILNLCNYSTPWSSHTVVEAKGKSTDDDAYDERNREEHLKWIVLRKSQTVTVGG